MRLFAAALLLSIGLMIGPASAQDTLPYVEFSDCPMTLPDDLIDGEGVECGYLVVPEDRSDPSGPTVELAFAILYAPAEDYQPDPVIYLAGGPGSSALDEIDSWQGISYLQDRDLILLDQRGTGYSYPSLNCPEIEQSEDDATQACHDRLLDEGVNLQAYNSAENAADIADLRLVLGYDEWNLYGISYGTRLALTVMRDAPDGIRSVVIDSVYPPEINSWEEYGSNTADVFGRLLAACAVDNACDSAYPDLEQRFYSQIESLDAEPAEYIGIDPDTGNGVEKTISGIEVIDRLFQLMYSTDNIPLLPWVMNEITNENYAALDDLESGEVFNTGFRQSDEDLSDSEGMNLSVECQEEVAFLEEETALANIPAFPAALAENSAIAIQQTFADCLVWDVVPADASESQPVFSDISTLVVAGEFDPITPSAWAESAASTLSNSVFFMFPNAGHGVIDSSACGEDIMQAFLDDPTSEPDGSCLDELTAIEWAVP